MNNEPVSSNVESVQEICVEVFAGVSAIVTHEIRNTLAIINESAGLLDDLAVMAGPDGMLSCERVQKITKGISEQVSRGRALMTDLNTFAHSGDEIRRSADIRELMAIMVELTRRKARVAEIKVELSPGDRVQTITSPLVLEALIYLCLLFLYENANSGSSIGVAVADSGGRPSFAFTVPGGISSAASLPTPQMTLLTTYLKAEIRTEAEKFTVLL